MKTRSKLAAMLGAGALVFAVAGVALADTKTSPSTVDSGTTALLWNGSQGLPLNEECGNNADPGAAGEFFNGATANSYLLWLFTTDGGSANGEPSSAGFGGAGAPTITVDGNTYTQAYFTNGTWQIMTPGPLPSTSAQVNFTVNATGNGAWVLTISHGCDGTTTTSTEESSTTSTEESSTTSTEESSTTVTTEKSTTTAHTPTLPPTSEFGGTSSGSDSSWMLMAGLGMVLGSLLVLVPARAKSRR